MVDIEYGKILSASQARVILAAFGISRETVLTPDGMVVDYGGVKYWILQTETVFPSATSTSPDGTHIVYAPSDAEINIPNMGAEFDWSQLVMIAGLGIGAYVLVNVLKFMRD